jgi:hypothetical protein
VRKHALITIIFVFSCEIWTKCAKSIFEISLKRDHLEHIIFSYILRGHSTTTWTEFCHFWPPPPSLSVQFLYPERGQKQTFFDPLPRPVHVVIEWPFTISSTYIFYSGQFFAHTYLLKPCKYNIWKCMLYVVWLQAGVFTKVQIRLFEAYRAFFLANNVWTIYGYLW